ncbi:MAG: o-succinylbenzoate synthase [Crocinitomicaceae bacterium]
MYQSKFEKITLNFKQSSGTSRGVLTTKDSWIISLWRTDSPGIIGKGEASIIKTLSPDWSDIYEVQLQEVTMKINDYIDNIATLHQFPSIQFALETAKLDLDNGGYYQIFKTKTKKIPINGLVWMGTEDFMMNQLKEKIELGFRCIKMKIGAIDFESELSLLKFIRSKYSKHDMTIRVDANGAFSFEEALDKLDVLTKYDIHSIEQPIMAGQLDEMAKLCSSTPLPIALDEELIGVQNSRDKKKLLQTINPQYIILKPSLIGGISGTDEWIEIAEALGIDWWITSALESNVGLNAIAQYTATKNNLLPQGLGTGSLYTNNIEPFLEVKDGFLWL